MHKEESFLDADTAIYEIKKVLDQYDNLPSGLHRILIEAEPSIKLSKKYERITKPKTTKIDYINKARKDAEIGLHGEELVIN